MKYVGWMMLAAGVLFVACPGPSHKLVSTRRVKMPVFTAEELAKAESLHVVAGTPEGTVERVDEANEILVTFDAPMKALEAVPETVDFPLLLEPDVPGSCHWLGTRTVSFRPDTFFPVATEFKVTIPKGVKSLDGRMLKDDYEFEFETVRPQLENSRPYHEQELVELKSDIWLAFNVPMDPNRAKRFLRLETSNGAPAGFKLRLPRKGKVPKDQWWYSPADSANTLVLVLTRPLRIQTEFFLVLQEGLPAREGNLGLEEERKLVFKTFNRFRFEGIPDADGHYPEDALEILFSNPVPQENLLDQIRFKPGVKLPQERYDYASDHQYLYLDFMPETTYEVVLSKWLQDKFGNRLGRDVKVRLKTVSFRPAVTMPVGKGIVESGPKTTHPVWMVNIDSVAVRMRRFDASEVIPFWRSRYEYDKSDMSDESDEGNTPLTAFTYERMWKPKLQRNKRTLLPLDLRPGLSGRSSGFLFCELDLGYEPERGSRYHRAFLQVSPYGLTAKFSPENGLGYVTRLQDCSAVGNAGVDLRDDENRVLWSGRTDQKGFVTFPGWTQLGAKSRDEWSSPRVWMFVNGEQGEGFVHSEWGTGIYPYDFGVSYDWSPDPTEPTGFLFTEKGLYKQGDTVRIKGIVRYKQRGRWVIPSTRNCILTLTDSREEEVGKKDVSLSDWGSFDVTVPLAQDAVTGYYSMVLEQGEHEFYGSFRVEGYRPAEFEVGVKADKDEYVAGDRFNARISGKYLFGAPMSQSAVNWSISLEPTTFTPPGHDGFSFGPYMDETVEGSGVIGSGTGKLDAAGQVSVKAKLDLAKRLSSCRVTCEGTVTAENQRSISGRESYLVHRADRYIGAKATEDFVEVGDSLGLDIISAKPDGGLLAGDNVTVTVFRRIWRSARKAQTGGRYSWVSEKQDERVGSFKVKTASEPKRRWFKPAKPGYYWFKCEERDKRKNPVRTDLSFWVAGKGEAAWMMRDDDIVELVRDKDSYKPGDTARILVKSPWTRVKALVTVEREFVMDHFETEISGNAELVRIPVKEDYLPNVFVSVVLLKGRTADNKFGEEGEDLGKPGFKIGYVELPVSPDAMKLAVEVKPDQEEYRPGAEVILDVSVRDNLKNPVRAEVTLAVVDLGVLKLIGYETPDPFSVFYAQRPLSVATAESRLHVIGQRNYGEKGKNAGGGGMDKLEAAGRDHGYEFAYREKFLETALWLPSVKTDENGKARASFKLPDNLTTWQVIAVTATRDKFGSGDAKFKANKPLLLQASLPRFARPDDRFSAGVMVHNRTDKKMTVKVKASCGEGVELAGEATKQVDVEPNQPIEVGFDYRCTGGERAEFLFSASAGSEQDGLKMSLPVRSPAVTEAVAVYEQTMDSLVMQTVSAPADAFSGVGGLEVTLASSGLAGLERGLEYLRIYPYECLEQRMSKILPFIAGEDVINQFKLSELRGTELREFVQTELNLVPRYQDESGGFHFWAGFESRDKPSPYLSAYCMYVLAMAKRNGYQVNSHVVELGRSYLENWLGYAVRGNDWPYSVDEFLTTKCLAVYALGLWDTNIESYVNTLTGSLDQISVFGKAYLLKAMATQPRHAYVEDAENQVIRAMNNKLKLEPTMAHYEEESEGGWIFQSNVRTTAAVLQALLEARGQVEFAEKAVKWLVTERKSGRWRTTQENAYVFDALATFYRAYEKTRPDFTATVSVEGRSILSQAFSGRSLETARQFVPIDSLAKKPQQVEVSKKGAGRVYYGMRLTYAPKGELRPMDEGIRIEKSIKPVGRGSGFVRGEQYLVTLKVYTPQDRLFVVVDDPLPAGLEIVNTSFETEKQQSSQTLARARSGDVGSYWWGDFDHEELYDDRYVLFATYLEKGVHTKTYLVKALTRGKFFMPATKAEEMYTPEVFGRTGQSWLEVR